jgi:phosphate transport system ATP-binding protein
MPLHEPSSGHVLPDVPAAQPPADDPVVLSADALSVWYGTSLALKDIDIKIPRHQITA